MVIINGEQKHITYDRITYEQICNYAGFPTDRAISVTWHIRGGGAGGTLHHGQSIGYSEGMIFNVADTSNA